ncbi:methylamine dehydrogenase accessory protein MauD [Bradyrhizobium sp. BRP22]|uniref:methylamine dehydrogenase accessory protein MauD n=1 Tax=Bradyrhizobium sp. BRP22 TaxID=2793821 RepID=UPI001CD78FE9|nr:methylamine dehydrogenase accessory protein MauD [Bradyrhizobium sp. BRP22]
MDGLVVAFALLWVLVIALAIAVFALARQVGILFERIAPMGALITDSGPTVGEKISRFDLTALDGRAVAIGSATLRSQLLFFVSPTCPVCKKLLPILSSVAAAESSWLDVVLAGDGDAAAHRTFVARRRLEKFPFVLSRELGIAFRVSRLPYAALIDSTGAVRAKGLINNREQLESLFNARELGVSSVQSYLDAVRTAQ